MAFALVILALSAVFAAGRTTCSTMGVNVVFLKVPVGGFLVLVAVVVLAPLVVFGGPLRRSAPRCSSTARSSRITVARSIAAGSRRSRSRTTP